MGVPVLLCFLGLVVQAVEVVVLPTSHTHTQHTPHTPHKRFDLLFVKERQEGHPSTETEAWERQGLGRKWNKWRGAGVREKED